MMEQEYNSNRQIKFRIRSNDSNEIIGYERINQKGVWEHKFFNSDNWLTGSLTFGQEYMRFSREEFVGVFDINKKEIYEKDIVRYDKTEFIGLISFDNFTWLIKINKKWQPSIYGTKNLDIYGHKSLEVIGNIFENADLLKHD